MVEMVQRELLVLFFPHAFFDLILHVGLGIVEFTDAFSQTTHEFRDLTSAEKNENGQYDEDPFSAAGHRDQEYGVGCHGDWFCVTIQR
jgi:hypothetical protein